MSKKARRLVIFAIGCAISLVFGDLLDAPFSYVIHGLPGAIVIWQTWNPIGAEPK